MKKNKIGLIISSLRNGGSERVMSELANLWAQNPNLEIFLILLTNQQEFYKIDERVEIITPKKGYQKNILSKLYYKIWILFHLRNTCKKNKFDSILSFGERYNNIVLLSLLYTKNKVFVSDRSSPFLNLGRFQNFLRNRLYNNAYGIVAQTQTAKKVLFENTKNINIKVINNPIREIQSKTKYKKNNIILNVGRNVISKNQLELIDIFVECEDYKDWKLKIIGNGPLKESLLERVKMLKLNNNVEILDFTTDIDYYFNESSIFAFSSLKEGFPNALLEAKAHGLACVAYNCETGPNELIENDVNGYLIALNDKSDFKNKLQKLMSSSEIRKLFSEDKETIKIKHSMDFIGAKYLEFILN